MSAESIARALRGRKSGRGWVARCPCHNDRSLRVNTNPIPLSERITCTITEGGFITGLGPRTLKKLIAEQRLETTKPAGRRLILVSSLLKLLEAGAGAPLVEPPQLRKARGRV